MSEMIALDKVAALALQLSPLDRIKLVERIMAVMQFDLATCRPIPKHSLYGLCADLGGAPAADEIDQARREMWRAFPREDI